MLVNHLDMKYSIENWVPQLLEKVPGFKSVWEAHVDFWDGEPAGITNDMIELAAYTHDQFERNQDTELRVIFQFIESLIAEGTPEVKNGACTGFLESILNPITADSPQLELLDQLLGPHSRAYCKAWLKFSGNVLPGFE